MEHPHAYVQNNLAGPYADLEIVPVTVTPDAVPSALFDDAAASVGLLQIEAVTFHGFRYIYM